MAHTIEDNERLIQNAELEQFTCDTCRNPATISVIDAVEIPSTDPEGWRMFKESGARYGCPEHPVVAMAYYIDGRELPAAQCVPEKCQPEEKFKTAPELT